MRNEKVVLFYGEPVSHYSYDGIYYSIYFPFHWVLDTKPNTGPKHCQYCRIDGCTQLNFSNGAASTVTQNIQSQSLSVDTIFVGYCVDCAVNEYQCSRGHGFEMGEEIVKTERIETSSTKTYLRHTKYDNGSIQTILQQTLPEDDRLSIRSISNESNLYELSSNNSSSGKS